MSAETFFKVFITGFLVSAFLFSVSYAIVGVIYQSPRHIIFGIWMTAMVPFVYKLYRDRRLG